MEAWANQCSASPKQLDREQKDAPDPPAFLASAVLQPAAEESPVVSFPGAGTAQEPVDAILLKPRFSGRVSGSSSAARAVLRPRGTDDIILMAPRASGEFIQRSQYTSMSRPDIFEENSGAHPSNSSPAEEYQCRSTEAASSPLQRTSHFAAHDSITFADRTPIKYEGG